MLAVAMGVGRFAYTPLIPVMQSSAGLSHAMAGIVASSNLAGYLIGALVAMSGALRRRRLSVVRWSLAVIVATTAAMAVASPAVWLSARFATGVASGFAFVLGSSIVLDRAALEGKHGWAGAFYTGVGAGIVLSGVAVPPFSAAGGWRWGWLGLALLSLGLCALTLPWFVERGGDARLRDDSAAPVDRRLFWWLFAAYGGQGVGYIIPATFMVAMIAATPELARFANLSWIVVGLVAIPSTFVWDRLGLAFGRGTALAAALLIQAAGIAAPLAVRSALGVTLAAVTLGGTFVGITVLANGLGRELYPERSHVAIGRLATIFGLGQIAGPLAAAALLSRTGSYDAAIVCAALVLAASAALMFAGLAALAVTRSRRR